MNAALYAQVPATDERERLILEHLPCVRWIAIRIHERLGGSVALDDLISAGVIGLINAVDSFDPSFNAKLKTYAEHKNSVMKYQLDPKAREGKSWRDLKKHAAAEASGSK